MRMSRGRIWSDCVIIFDDLRWNFGIPGAWFGVKTMRVIQGFGGADYFQSEFFWELKAISFP